MVALDEDRAIMNYTLTKPCADCPFLRKGGVRLSERRIIEITNIFTGTGPGSFSCHKTNKYYDECDLEDENSRHCAGALIFAEKNETPTQLMRIVERLGRYDRTKLEPHYGLVFDDVGEMLETAI